ncbi:MFS general substrate transporter [Cryphonectria parasitica EP155]|uniref:MFS general substrate transporter n=1 Tax=Cryphonectria parasitica (strain ATCC 38755 / EP155) TaxID=660469 RepID=A0A9P4XUY9_CRYP1|nr:MFS general substrate transporter [Cryphonectria parasitica EP155]KAF3761474.1 MFS general substrate transporter [Cryphonectria parasitica EP155]
MNWSSTYKAWLTFELGLVAFLGSVGSSIITPAETIIEELYNVSHEATVLVLSLFVLGFALGPLIWAPISEVYGRRWSILPAVFVLGLFSIATAVSNNAASIFATRFMGGIFGSAPISNVSAALGDFYSPKTRGVAMAFLAMCVVGGPCLAPLMGAAIVVNPHLGWRWTEYILAIMVFAVFLLALIDMPETYPPVLLKRKAKQMRKATGDERYWHPQEHEKISVQNVLTKYLTRPVRMFFTEPMLMYIAIYASFVYGLLFLTLEVFPIVFYEQRKWGLVVSELPFLGLFVGVLCAMFVNILNQPLYIRAMVKNNGRAVPEARLPPMIVGGFLFSIGLFWFGWTATPRYPWASPVVAAAFIGAGFNIVFQQCLNFLVDTYGPFAASAMASNTFLRSLLACALPLAARPMFLNMGIGPAASLLGGISCLALPVPLIFMKYGVKLRKMSKFAPAYEG